MKKQKCILIIGMHRSGTSAMSGVLKIMGIDFGNNLFGSTKHNKKGHFEHSEILEINEEILIKLGTTWDDIKDIKNYWYNSKKLFSYKEQLKNIIIRDFNKSECFGIKEPRISILLPLYIIIFKELKIEVNFIIMKRKKFEITESLKNRNEFSLLKSLKLYKKYEKSIEKYTSNKKRLIINFDDLINKPKKTISLINKKFNMNFKNYSYYKKKITKFLDPNLKHHTFNYEKYLENIAITLENKDELIRFKEEVIKYNDKEIEHKDRIINEKDRIINKKDKIIENKNKIITNMENSFSWTISQKIGGILDCSVRFISGKKELYSNIINSLKKHTIKTPINLAKKTTDSIKHLSNNRLLCITNSHLNGGSIITSKKLLADNQNNYDAIFILSYLQGNTFEIDLNGKMIEKVEIKDKHHFEEIIKKYKISSIFVVQLARMDVMSIIKIISSSNIPYSYFIHDYLCLCPSIKLIHCDNKYRGSDCLNHNFCNHEKILPKWRKEFHDFLKTASSIYAVSETAKNIILQIYTDLQIQSLEHHSVHQLFNIYNEDITKKSELNIGVIGSISPQKGSKIIYSIADEIIKKNIPIKIKIIGEIYPKILPKYEGVIEITGKYAFFELPKLLKEKNVSFVLFPAIWPETYSYVCDESIQMGFPILMFDLGAQKDRINNEEFGWLIDLSEGYEGIFKKILQLYYNRRLILNKAREIKEKNHDQIDVIMPIYNGYEHIEKSINSIIKNTDMKSQLIIIDDCSTDKKISILLDKFMNNPTNNNPNLTIKICINKFNMGFAKSANIGLHLSNNHCVIINSNVEIPPNWLSRIISPIKLDLSIASVISFSNSAKIFSVPGINKQNSLNDLITKSLYNLQKLNKKNIGNVSNKNGFCMLINRNIINEIGYFNEEDFNKKYGEKTDWCLRAAEKGYKTVHIQNLFN